MNLLNFPKVELHVHLDGSVRPKTVCDILNLNIEEVEKNMKADSSCKDLNDYLTKFNLPLKILQTKENISRVSYEFAKDLKKDGVIYSEVRFAPILHTKEGLSCEEVIDAVIEGISKVDININLIICLMRNVSEEDNLKVIQATLKYLNNKVVGFDCWSGGSGAGVTLPLSRWSCGFTGPGGSWPSRKNMTMWWSITRWIPVWMKY